MLTTLHRPGRQRTRLYERTIAAPAGKVDRDGRVIRGVKIIGRISKNGREYTADALRKARGLYEGAGVFIDHELTGGKTRTVNSRFGELRNVRFQDDALWGDLHYLASHPLAEMVLEVAERMPSKLGLSHAADGQTRNIGGKVIVEHIHSVQSVDVVATPATTGGLFESVSDPTNEYPRDGSDFVRELKRPNTYRTRGYGCTTSGNAVRLSESLLPGEADRDAASDEPDSFYAELLQVLDNPGTDASKLERIRAIVDEKRGLHTPESFVARLRKSSKV